MPILVKMEPKTSESEAATSNETFNVQPVNNETVTIAAARVMNETVTIEAAGGASCSNPNATVTLDKNPHDSIMTEDNDDGDYEDEEDAIPLAKITAKKAAPPPLPLKLKKNEVFK